MTDNQQAALAKITLSNTAIIGSMAQTLYLFVESAHEVLPNARLIPLLSSIEQLQAALVPLQASVEQARKELGF